MVYWSSSSIRSLASCRVLTVCSRIDCILGPHWSHRPLATRTTGSAVRSRSEKIDAGRTKIVGKVYRPNAVDQGLRDLFGSGGVNELTLCHASPHQI